MSDPAGRTLDELVARVGFSAPFLHAVLEDEQQRGNVELVDGRWYATERARTELGAALAAFNPTEED